LVAETVGELRRLIKEAELCVTHSSGEL
jgi:hypothetical protein